MIGMIARGITALVLNMDIKLYWRFIISLGVATGAQFMFDLIVIAIG